MTETATLDTGEKVRKLPSGSMRKQLRKGRAQGAAAVAALITVIGLTLIALAPVELSVGVRPTTQPIKQASGEIGPRVELPPCTDMASKDCMRIDDPVRYVPEPGSLLLVLGALGALIKDQIMAALTAVIETLGRLLGMKEDDE